MHLIPDPGTLFYVTVKPIKRQVVLEGDVFVADTVKTVTHTDGSWRADIFRAVAKDESHLVAKKLTGYKDDTPYLLRIEDYVFSPVGPDVAKAMGFDL